jgi:hypothetical protein
MCAIASSGGEYATHLLGSAAIGTVSNDPMASTLFVYLVPCAEAGCHWVGRLLLRGS